MSFSLSLSGGGCRAAAHIGVLKALEQHKLKPIAISATSAGALIAALYCSGISVNDIEDICLELEKHGHKLIDWNIVALFCSALAVASGIKKSSLSVLKGDRFYSFLKYLFKDAHLSTAKLPLFISSVDLLSGKTLCFSKNCPNHKIANTVWQNDILLRDAVYSSCCLPSVFPPFKHGGYMLIDGGITNNLPVDFLFAADMPNIIAIDTGGLRQDAVISSLPEVIYRSISIMGERLKNCYVAGERLRIVPSLPVEADILSFDQMRTCIKAGFAATNELIPLINSF